MGLSKWRIDALQILLWDCPSNLDGRITHSWCLRSSLYFAFIEDTWNQNHNLVSIIWQLHGENHIAGTQWEPHFWYWGDSCHLFCDLLPHSLVDPRRPRMTSVPKTRDNLRTSLLLWDSVSSLAVHKETDQPCFLWFSSSLLWVLAVSPEGLLPHSFKANGC